MSHSFYFPLRVDRSQVVFAFADNCLAASLSGRAGNQEVQAMVSTSELRVLKGDLLHKLTGTWMNVAGDFFLDILFTLFSLSPLGWIVSVPPTLL